MKVLAVYHLFCSDVSLKFRILNKTPGSLQIQGPHYERSINVGCCLELPGYDPYRFG